MHAKIPIFHLEVKLYLLKIPEIYIKKKLIEPLILTQIAVKQKRNLN